MPPHTPYVPSPASRVSRMLMWHRQRNFAVVALLLCGCQPVHQQEPSGVIAVDSTSGQCLLKIDPAYGQHNVQISARCTPLEDAGVQVVTDACGTFELHPITERGPQDGLASLDGYWKVASHEGCPLRATSFPAAWSLQ